MRGRYPKPLEAKDLENNAGRRKAKNRPPKVPQKAPKIPTWLGQEGKKEWRRVISELQELGVLSRADRPGLEAYCRIYERWRSAEAAIDEHGSLFFKTRSGYRQQLPEVGVANKCLEQMRHFLAQFGLTPVSRTRLHIGEEKSANPADEVAEKRAERNAS